MKNQCRKKYRFYQRAKAAVILFALIIYSFAPAVLLSGAKLVEAAESGTASEPIQIDSVQELKEIANGLDKHYILTKDLKFESDSYWKPLGTAQLPFTGTLDGNGHKIQNLEILAPISDLGLFAYISNATIKNLIMENVNIQGENYTAALAAHAVGSSIIENCSASGRIMGAQHVGGLIGHYSGTGRIELALMSGEVYSTGYYAGGIVGRFDGGDILQSGNSADITSMGDSVGGIAGGIASGTATISDSFNSGDVKGTSHIGGVLGYQSGGSAAITTVCNIGAIVGSEDNAGGLVGYATSQCSIQESANLNTVNGRNFVGGLAGQLTAEAEVDILNSYNRGNITGKGGSSIGGLVGYLEIPAENVVQYSYSTGDVSGASNVGGLLGYGYQGNLKNAIAMNERVEATGSEGYRITGRLDALNESGNMAFEDMVVTVNGVVREIKSTKPAHTSQDGMNGTKTTVMKNNTYLELMGWDFTNIWQVAKDGNDYPQLKRLRLSPPEQVVKVVGVSLDKKARTLMLDETAVLKAYVFPANATNQELTWSSSNTEVVQADDTGVIKAKAVGSAVVSVKTTDGGYIAGCEITVVDAEGTEEDPIPIGTIQELRAITNGLDKHYVLTQDLDLGADTDWQPIGRVTAPFTGAFDGQGYTIRNLSNQSQADYFGLFGYATDARISELTLADVDIKGSGYTAALVAVSAGATKISDCTISGTVDGTENYVGGFVSYMTGASLIENAQMSGVVSGSNYVGGLVGRLNSGEIKQSQSTATVTATGKYCGTLAGIVDQNGKITPYVEPEEPEPATPDEPQKIET